MSEKEFEIFEGKTFQDLTKDIYENTTTKRQQIDELVSKINAFIQTLDDAILVAPIIKDFIDASVKNDEHLVKLASVLQRIITKSQSGTDEDTIGLSDLEKEELMATLQDTVDELQKESNKTKDEHISPSFLDN